MNRKMMNVVLLMCLATIMLLVYLSKNVEANETNPYVLPDETKKYWVCAEGVCSFNYVDCTGKVRIFPLTPGVIEYITEMENEVGI